MRVGTRYPSMMHSQAGKDHPHACGDKYTDCYTVALSPGSSPCVWGQEVFLIIKELGIRIIPMRVGTSWS